MKQVFQSLLDGSISSPDLAVPNVKEGHLLIKSKCSLISAGTERMLAKFGKSNFIEKAKQQPNKVKEVLNKLKTDGLLATYESVQSRLNEPLPLGYCNVGEVISIGKGVKGYQIGDRVASNGPHAEIFNVPENLCAKIPDNLNDLSASFTVLGSIALQGIRLAKPSFGETFLVSGLGLIGILTCQFLKANGCNVLGVDIDNKKCNLAKQLGVDVLQIDSNSDPVSWCLNNTDGFGVDGSIITASTESSEPIDIAALASRKRARIILIGVTGVALNREIFYKKEIKFQVSCSYGPGRYDNNYEINGNDYPIGFVRWTEQRNFQAVLKAFSNGFINTDILISHKFDFSKIKEAYELLINSSDCLGIIILYKKDIDTKKNTLVFNNKKIRNQKNNINVSFIGSGNYANRFLIPTFYKSNVKFNYISSFTGTTSTEVAKKFNFKYSTTNVEEVFKDDETNLIVIATRHNSHSKLIIKSLNEGKNVFVEKPLCLSVEELNSIDKAYMLAQEKFTIPPKLMIGFNRRFSPCIKEIKNFLDKEDSPKSFIYTINAGELPPNHWHNDVNIGGGRLISEACHFVDILCFLSNSEINSIQLISLKNNKYTPETFSIQISMNDGSIGNVHYFANGSKSFPKERLEVFVNKNIILLDNFKKIKTWGNIKLDKINKFNSEKGQENCINEFILSLKSNTECPIPYKQIYDLHKWLLPLKEKKEIYLRN